MSLEGFHFFGLVGNQLVDGSEAISDSHLFLSLLRYAKRTFENASFTKMRLIEAIIECQKVGGCRS